MNESSEVWKDKSMAWVRRYKRFREDVLEYELETSESFSLHNSIVFLIYGMVCLVWNNFIIKMSPQGGLMCFGISALSLVNLMFCKVYLANHKRYVAKATNVYVFLLIKSIMSLDLIWNDGMGGNISWTLLVCSIITTSMISIVPHHYVAVIGLTVISDTIESIIKCTTVVDVLYNMLDSFIIAIFCIGINIIFSKHQYAEFMRKEELKYESSRDMLTQLYNRRFIERYYDIHAKTEELCAIIMLDLDDFKKANDIFGHETGDDVLCRTSDILRKYFRDRDCVARLGGDEFAVFLHGIAGKDGIVERIHKLLYEFPIVLTGDTTVEVSVSIGIAFKESGESIEYSKLCNKADEAMYRAKRMGKGKAIVSPEKNTRDMIIVA